MNNITKEDAKQSLSKLKDHLSIVSTTNDNVLKDVSKLKLVLLNLKIENARINESTGIQPIASDLDKITKNIEKTMDNLIRELRMEIRKELTYLEVYLENEK